MLVGKPEGKRPRGRLRHRWDDIRIDIRVIRWKFVDWIHLAQDRNQSRALLKRVMNLRLRIF
jgi:hypothetical protein